LVEASPSERAEEVLRRLVETREVNGALLLEADPAWAEAIDTVLEEEGIRGEQLRRAGREDSCRRVSPLLLQIEPVFLADRKA
jgi:hypothetical protein